MAARKTTAKKAAPKKSTSRKTTTRKAGTQKVAGEAGDRSDSGTEASSQDSSAEGGGGSRRRSSAPRAAAQKRRTGPAVAGEAARQLAELTGRAVEGVTGLSRTEDGWTVEVEVLEMRRIPETTDVLAGYEVTVDDDGDLLGYQRLRRYVRGTPGESGR